MPVLFLDLDGTLAPLVDHPDDARVPGATGRVLRRLQASGARVVLVSGRSVAGVLHVARMRPDAILGDHGARIWTRGVVRPWLRADAETLARVVREVAPALEQLRGVRLEHKDRSLAIHLRLAPGARAATTRVIVAILRRVGLRVLRGKRVIDGQLPGVDKGTAVRRYLATVPAGGAVLYAGDDTTDQDAFAALRGDAVTVVVGTGARGANFRTRHPSTFAAWLHRLAAARSRKSESGP